MITLAERMKKVPPSAVREILKVTEQPEVRSFAGGLPAPELFPVEALALAHQRVLERAGAAALQYSTTEGFAPLRAWVAERYSRRGAPTTAEQIVITHGSQQGIDLVARVLLDPGAVVVTENPTYLAALQVFQAAQATIVGVESDREGMILEALAKVFATKDVRLLYVVPTFANPTGVTWSPARRAGVMALAQAWNVPVLEDDPYEALRFSGTPVAPLAAFDDGLTISLGTFSKLLAPGLRVGWLRAPERLRGPLVVAKQAADLHTSSISQRVVMALFDAFDLDAHLELLRSNYRERCEVMCDAVDAFFPRGTTFRRPDGGLFLWLELPPGLDTLALLPSAVSQHRVAYVPGAPFFVDRVRANTVRLNFSNCQPAALVDGMRRLGGLFSAALESPSALAS